MDGSASIADGDGDDEEEEDEEDKDEDKDEDKNEDKNEEEEEKEDDRDRDRDHDDDREDQDDDDHDSENQLQDRNYKQGKQYLNRANLRQTRDITRQCIHCKYTLVPWLIANWLSIWSWHLLEGLKHYWSFSLKVITCFICCRCCCL